MKNICCYLLISSLIFANVHCGELNYKQKPKNTDDKIRLKNKNCIWKCIPKKNIKKTLIKKKKSHIKKAKPNTKRNARPKQYKPKYIIQKEYITKEIKIPCEKNEQITIQEPDIILKCE